MRGYITLTANSWPVCLDLALCTEPNWPEPSISFEKSKSFSKMGPYCTCGRCCCAEDEPPFRNLSKKLDMVTGDNVWAAGDNALNRWASRQRTSRFSALLYSLNKTQLSPHMSLSIVSRSIPRTKCWGGGWPQVHLCMRASFCERRSMFGGGVAPHQSTAVFVLKRLEFVCIENQEKKTESLCRKHGRLQCKMDDSLQKTRL